MVHVKEYCSVALLLVKMKLPVQLCISVLVTLQLTKLSSCKKNIEEVEYGVRFATDCEGENCKLKGRLVGWL